MTNNTVGNTSSSGNEIGLRRLIRIISHWWRLIVTTTMIAAAAVFLFVSIKPVQYEADVTLVNCPNISVSRSTISSVASDKELFHQLYTKLSPKPEGINDYGALIRLLHIYIPRTKSGKFVSSITLSATAYTAGDAARIVNMWAGLFAAEVKDKQHDSLERDILVMQKQFNQARTNLSNAEDAVAAAQVRRNSFSNELKSLKQKRNDYQAERQRIAFLIQDAVYLHGQFSFYQSGKVSSKDDQDVLALLLQSAGNQPPTQIQASQISTLLHGDSIDDRMHLLNNIQKDLENRLQKIDRTMATLNAQIQSLQKDLQKAQNEQNKLTHLKRTALHNYEYIASQLQKLYLEKQLFTEYITIAKPAEAQLPPLNRRRSFNTLLAGIIGAMAGFGIAFTIDWWQKEEGKMD